MFPAARRRAIGRAAVRRRTRADQRVVPRPAGGRPRALASPPGARRAAFLQSRHGPAPRLAHHIRTRLMNAAIQRTRDVLARSWGWTRDTVRAHPLKSTAAAVLVLPAAVLVYVL